MRIVLDPLTIPFNSVPTLRSQAGLAVPNDTLPSSPNELFQRWKRFLEQGSLETATFIAAGEVALVDPLQELIRAYLSERAAGVDDTLTAFADESNEQEVEPDMPGLTVLAPLGRGGMGVVYKVRDALDREFALKLVRRKGLSQAARERFLEEARAMFRLNHPNLVRIHHYDFLGDRPYFLMPVYPSSLKDRLEEFQANPAGAIRLMADVAAGVGHLHENGLIHRDVKPHNILLTAEGNAAVSDFGLVKDLHDVEAGQDIPMSAASGSRSTKPSGARRSQTVAGVVVGTRRYMSPEQAAGLTQLANPRWDVWSMGIVLHELAVGRPPASSENPASLLDPATPDDVAPSILNPDIDPRLEAIIQKCLARDGKDRFANGTELADRLRNLFAVKPSPRYRARMLAAACLLLIAAVMAVWSPWSTRKAEASIEPKPIPAIESVQQLVSGGQPAILMGEKGWPVWHEVAVGADLVKPHLSEADETLTLDSSRLVMMDLPPTGLERFRFEVQVRQLKPDDATRFGIYAARHRLPSRIGETECFASLWFNETPSNMAVGKTTGPCLAGLRTYTRVAGSGGILGGIDFKGRDLTDLSEQKSTGKFRSLALEVTPKSIDMFVDGDHLDSIALPLAANDEALFAEAAKLLPGIQTAFGPAGGYGILVHGGPASFRNAVVKPLK